jgi:hypothetical protein
MRVHARRPRIDPRQMQGEGVDVGHDYVGRWAQMRGDNRACPGASANVHQPRACLLGMIGKLLAYQPGETVAVGTEEYRVLAVSGIGGMEDEIIAKGRDAEAALKTIALLLHHFGVPQDAEQQRVDLLRIEGKRPAENVAEVMGSGLGGAREDAGMGCRRGRDEVIVTFFQEGDEIEECGFLVAGPCFAR